MRSRLVVAALASAVIFAACSTATAPAPNLAGSWTLTGLVTGPTGDTISVTGDTLYITQTGATFVGYTLGVNWYEVGLGSSPGSKGSLGVGNAPINGALDGDSVTFTIADIFATTYDDSMYFAGSVHGNTMGGRANAPDDGTFQGTWSATKN